MRRMLAGVLVAVLLSSCAPRAGEARGENAAAGGASAVGAGWEDLLARGLEGWKRVPLPPGTGLSARNPWSFDDARRTVASKAEGIVEVLLTEREFGDGIFHVEWRFVDAGKEGYNGGIYVRTSPDASVWDQAQVAIKPERPVVGDLFGKTPVKGEPREVKVLSELPVRPNPPGEWNTYELTCDGPTLSLSVNGTTTATWTGLEVPMGRFGLQAEYFDMEFRKVLFRPLR